MKRVSLVIMLAASILALSFTGAFTKEGSLIPAAVFPYEIVSENYVPSLYFAAPQGEPDGLVAAPDFPYSTVDLCYSPSLYYKAGGVIEAQR